MYIYRAVRSRGESLQEGANQLKKYCHDIQLFPLSNSRNCKLLTPGLAVPSNARGKRLLRARLHLCAERDSAFPGGKLLVPMQDSGHVRTWFQRQSFRRDCGTTDMESTQLLERLG